jgi:hypothetical protein
MPPSDEQWAALAREFRGAAARFAPEWTDANTGDPGTTVLELLAYALDDLVDRTGAATPHDGRRIAEEVGGRAAALAAAWGSDSAGDGCGGGLRRVRYFSGKLLDADDLRSEQGYLLDRLTRRNRSLYGAGVVDGLAVVVADGGDGPPVVSHRDCVRSARARDFVDACCRVALPAADDVLLVIAYRERAGACSALTGDSGIGADAAEPTLIAETPRRSWACAGRRRGETSRASGACARRWHVDRSFQAQDVRR